MKCVRKRTKNGCDPSSPTLPYPLPFLAPLPVVARTQQKQTKRAFNIFRKPVGNNTTFEKPLLPACAVSPRAAAQQSRQCAPVTPTCVLLAAAAPSVPGLFSPSVSRLAFSARIPPKGRWERKHQDMSRQPNPRHDESPGADVTFSGEARQGQEKPRRKQWALYEDPGLGSIQEGTQSLEIPRDIDEHGRQVKLRRARSCQARFQTRPSSLDSQNNASYPALGGNTRCGAPGPCRTIFGGGLGPDRGRRACDTGSRNGSVRTCFHNRWRSFRGAARGGASGGCRR